MLLLAGCSASQQPLTRSEVIEVPVPYYVELPTALTDELPEPAPPPTRCAWPDLSPALCAEDALVWIEDWRAFRRKANDDRKESARLGNTPRLGNRSDSDAGSKP